MKRRLLLLFSFLMFACLCACGETQVPAAEELPVTTAAPTPTPVPTPEPTPIVVEILGESFGEETRSLDLSALTDEDAPAVSAAIALLPKLEEISLVAESGRTELSFESLDAIRAAAPEAKLHCTFSLYGHEVSEESEELRFKNETLGNEAVDVFRSALPYLTKLKLLRVQNCKIDDYDAMAELRSDFAEVNIVWSVDFEGYPFMTDTLLINTLLLTDTNVELLKYMNDVKFLDIGHNTKLTNIEFVRYFPKLTTIIVSLTNISDLTPLEACPEIEFLECFTTPISDISIVSSMKKLEYLNLGDMWNLEDLSPVYGMDTLKLVRICGRTRDHITQDMIEELRAQIPNAEVNDYGGHSAASGGWRYLPDGSYTERYMRLSRDMRYLLYPDWQRMQVNSPSSLDPNELPWD